MKVTHIPFTKDTQGNEVDLLLEVSGKTIFIHCGFGRRMAGEETRWETIYLFDKLESLRRYYLDEDRPLLCMSAHEHAGIPGPFVTFERDGTCNMKFQHIGVDIVMPMRDIRKKIDELVALHNKAG